MNIYQHFRVEEQTFIDQVVEWKQATSNYFLHKLTDFLDPRQQQILSTVIGQNSDITFSFLGGTSSTERKRALIYPTYYEPNVEDFELAAFQVHYPHKFIELSHRDLLGAMMGLGIKREKFGDIYIQDDIIQIVVASEISSYVEANLQNVGRGSVQLEPITLMELRTNKEEWQEKLITASSLRLDLVLSEIYQKSRSKITPFIENKRVKVNWKIVEQPAFQIQNGDYLSVRGLGRSKILSIEGKTKKDKWKITIGLRK